MKIKSKIKRLIHLALILTPLVVTAKDNIKIEVYGTRKINTKVLDQKFGHEIGEYYKSLQNPKAQSKKALAKYEKNQKALYKWLFTQGAFSYINISSIIMPDDNDVYVTIDVIEQADEKRNRQFRTSPEGVVSDPAHLIKAWQDYQSLAFTMFLNHQYSKLKDKHCKAFHCPFGFKDPKLKKYAKLFDSKVPHYTDRLAKMVHYDTDPKKRAAAVFLLGHAKDTDEVIDILTPAIRDANSVVRNNAMRVMTYAIKSKKPVNPPVDEFIAALDFPHETDRNKAISAIDALSQYPEFRNEIKTKASLQLVRLLQSIQPNLNLFAYRILKTLNPKPYPMEAIAQWTAWAKRVTTHKRV